MKTAFIILTSNLKTVTYSFNTCCWQAVQQSTCNSVVIHACGRNSEHSFSNSCFLGKFTCSCQLYFQLPSDLRLTVLVFSILALNRTFPRRLRFFTRSLCTDHLETSRSTPSPHPLSTRAFEILNASAKIPAEFWGGRGGMGC